MGFEIWFLIGAALVFFMQCGFAMVETGFTRAKNAGNIIMKNLMDFCLGTVVFMLLGAGLLLGEDALGGFLGAPNMKLFTVFTSGDEAAMSAYGAQFVFNLVFCATAATIVSGAMAERTKFLTYCVYSVLISLVVYPIEAHWVWGGGWLAELGFVDFAGSAAIHMVGGISALIGAAMLGARIGKYKKDASGKLVPQAIPGHNLVIGALGVFILWFGWYGFNGAACTSLAQLSSVFVNTTIAPAIATVTTMVFTWIKNKKPDVSMCLNASLAGLVGVTAGCSIIDPIGATCIGFVSGILVVLVVEFMDKKLKIDDPVGAIAVHMANGIWGTIAVGLFATKDGAAFTGGELYGLFYGGGAKLLGIQLLGFISIAAWTAATMTLIFFVLKKTMGLRVTSEEEIGGLDSYEHGLVNAYDFGDAPAAAGIVHGTSFSDSEKPPVDTAVPVEIKNEKIATSAMPAGAKMHKVVIVTRTGKFDALKNALNAIGVTGMTVTNVLGCGMQKGASQYYRGVKLDVNLLPKIKVEIVVCKVPVSAVIAAAKEALYTGSYGDGKIFVYNIENVVKVRTGEEDFAALQDD
ncbi:MAG: ammonium transporter [Clostridiales bacterium]|nr:ammonium transporter [Clostridiales bacterium]